MPAIIDESNNRANMAYIGQVPWHGLGDRLQPGASIEEWQVSAGMTHNLKAGRVMTRIGKNIVEMPDHRMLVRDDTNVGLSIVSDKYHIVQPKQVLEFFRNLIADSGFEMETAGCLRGGRKYWALANTKMARTINKDDELKAYLLLATSCDGSMSSVGRFTSVRTVCQNTLSMALQEAGDKVKIRHSSEFNAESVKEKLGLAGDTFEHHVEQAQALSKKKVSKLDAVAFFCDVAGIKIPEQVNFDELPKLAGRLFHTYQNGIGQDLTGTRDTAWGLVNAVTRYFDHEKAAASVDNRLNRAWFGDGDRMKTKAWNHALAL